jgi:hypothetical protein
MPPPKMIIQDIDMIGTFVVEFLHGSKRHWCAKKQIGQGVTLVGSMFIEESEEDEVVEQHFVKA